MALQFPVKPRTILLCDYSLGGFRAPEMVKRRPAVVITGALPRRNNLHTVVPLSGTESDSRNLYHCKIELPAPLPAPFDETIWWVKADMIATVSGATRPLSNGARSIWETQVSDKPTSF
jgi:uncharacterized protein YifN (PemK superfamily)